MGSFMENLMGSSMNVYGPHDASHRKSHGSTTLPAEIAMLRMGRPMESLGCTMGSM